MLAILPFELAVEAWAMRRPVQHEHMMGGEQLAHGWSVMSLGAIHSVDERCAMALDVRSECTRDEPRVVMHAHPHTGATGHRRVGGEESVPSSLGVPQVHAVQGR